MDTNHLCLAYLSNVAHESMLFHGTASIGKLKTFQEYKGMKHRNSKELYWAVQKNLVKGCRQTLDCYCVSCELLSASIADALWFVNMVCLPLIAEQNAHEICLTQECLQIVRRLLWSQTTTLSLRNINPMFEGSNLCVNFFGSPSIFRFGIFH